MDKKLKIIFGALIAAGTLATGYYFFFNPKKNLNVTTDQSEQKLGVWEYTPTISNPLKEIADGNSVSLGSLETNKINATVKKGSFDASTEITLTSPESVPEIDTNVVGTIGAPVKIESNTEHRLNESATLTFALNAEEIPQESEVQLIRIAYYNGNNWDLIKPTKVDLENNTVTFETFHFSLFGLTKLKDETKITKQWIKSQALDNKLKEDINSTTDEVAGKVIDLMLEKMGISDKSIKGQIIGDVLKDDSYKEIYDAYQSGDVVGFNQKIALLAGQKIASNVPESVMSEALGNLAGDSAGDVEAVAQAAGYMAEGQYKEAAKIIGENIADKFLITTATKIAVEVVDGQIQSWKNTEIEAAYKAYTNGANNYFYGYNVDKGDFDTIWDQMRGIRRQLELEAVNKENEVRLDAGMPELSAKQIEVIRENVKRTYKKQFENRQKQEEEIKKEEEKLKAIFNAFDEAGFLGRIPPRGLDKGYDLETRLDVLNHFVEKMMRDTNRYEITDKIGLLVDKKLAIDDLVRGTRIYFGGPDGPSEYRKFLEERFGISQYVALSELVGQYKGQAKITNFEVADELPEEIISSFEGAGCEVTEGKIDTEGAKDKKQDVNFTVEQTSSNTGTIVTGDDLSKNEVPFTYAEGKITIQTEEEGVFVRAELTPTNTVTGIEMTGSITAKYESLFSLEATMEVSKTGND